MKNIVVLMLVLCGLVFSTERVNMTCKFKAIAEGYEDESYNVNLILMDGGLYNSDGSEGGDVNKVIFGRGAGEEGPLFSIVDSDNDPLNFYLGVFKKGVWYSWEFETGEFSCRLRSGWVKEVNSLIIKEQQTPIVDFSTQSKDSTVVKSISGDRSPESILRVIRAHIGGFRYTYEKYLKENPGIGGKISLKFTISPAGDIIAISIASSNTGNSGLDNEFKDVARRMKFDQIEKGNVTVTYAFVLDRQ